MTADGALGAGARKCHPWKTVTAVAIARNEALWASKYLGRALWR